MSILSEQVKRLRDYASDKRGEIADICNEAARTIEELSDKLHAANMERSSAHYHGGWIPVKWHSITEEERKENEYPDDWVVRMDCEMPNDEDEILITVRGITGALYVEKDVCYMDDGWTLDSGYGWVEDVIAWMPLPKPYRAEEKDVTKP